MKTAGIVLLVIGLAGTLIFGIQALQDSESYSFLGINVAVSTANWTPVIVSAVILVIGIFLVGSGRRAAQ
jgi:hypothetical protein